MNTQKNGQSNQCNFINNSITEKNVVNISPEYSPKPNPVIMVVRTVKNCYRTEG